MIRGREVLGRSARGESEVLSVQKPMTQQSRELLAEPFGGMVDAKEKRTW